MGKIDLLLSRHLTLATSDRSAQGFNLPLVAQRVEEATKTPHRPRLFIFTVRTSDVALLRCPTLGHYGKTPIQ